ncbi:hypothetical protein F443_07524 [Phytophthora nicotianae P1569]|uniref:Uncharacterized protein n=1 Tax=Phytophthora nicotianae P1569 TaxID=1317065 RepID=V9FCF0_PHYNI|nr:hypothetical protein F443_07524 [Phytophthora nicotianae P1569]
MSAAIQLVEDVEDDQEKTVSTLDPRQLGQAASTKIMGWLREDSTNVNNDASLSSSV